MMKSMPLYSKLYTTWVDSNISLQSVLLEATRRTFEKTVEHQINSSGRDKDGKSCIDPEKYKEFYKIWIDTYSDTFKEFMKSGHYASDMGKFASIFIDFQSHNREIIEENYLKPNNLPTRTDIEEIHKESYDLRITVKQLVKDLKTSVIDAKQSAISANAEIEKLYNELKDAKQSAINANAEIEKLYNELKDAKQSAINAKQTAIDADTKIDKLRKEIQDQRVTVENLVKHTKIPVGTDEILSKKVDLSKSQKVDPSKKVEQTKKAELPNNKEVHT
jgi:hypothetical protein